MKNQPRTFNARALPRFLRAIYIAGLLPALLFLLNVQSIQAGSATWKASPNSGDWNTASNWSPATVPNGPSDIATFASSNITNVALSSNTEEGGIVFNAGASAFTITAPGTFLLKISGVGITNNSGITQNFVTTPGARAFFFGLIFFTNSATAGSRTVFTNSGSLNFLDESSAGNATIVNDAGGGTGGGYTTFNGTASAGNATIINNGSSVSNRLGGATIFDHRSSAANATLIANSGTGGGDGGLIFFISKAKGGAARLKLFGNGSLDISRSLNQLGGVTVGSIEGDGQIFLGQSAALSVGSNNLSTTFSGVIQDVRVIGGTGGSLTKIGRGKLVLKSRNHYTGGTTVKNGKLVVNNLGKSGTGSGPVQVEGGKLGGKGMIAGAVTIGTGNGAGAVLAPGYLHGGGRPGALTIRGPLTFNSDGIYQMELDSSNVTADEVVANGVTINAGAQFSFLDFGSAALPPGTLFTAINNTAANPIAGAFVNLPDGSTFTNNGNTFKVNYKGGDGNDLTLTVVR